MASIYFTVKGKLTPKPADGSECICCFDAIYLKAFQIDILTESGKYLTYVPGLLCDSCQDGIKDYDFFKG